MKTASSLLLVLFLTATALAAEPAAPCGTTVLVVRHAEASKGTADPELTETGVARATRLAAVGRDAGVTTVYVTQFRRTRDTAAPLVAATGATLVTVPVAGAEIREQAIVLAKRILEEHAGETVLVVGHSNTVPMLVEALGGNAVPEIAHDEHDRLYVVTSHVSGPVRVVAARY